VRRHRPRAAGDRWASFRACLRWDFGFTCALCLLHEADLWGGQLGEGLGGTTVEHHVARSADPSRTGDYLNCIYACRLCNQSRSAAPHLSEGIRLLDPTRDAWARHFRTVGDLLQPAPSDPAAVYTHACYELDDQRKVERRQARRELLTDRLPLLAVLEVELAESLRLADRLRQRDLRRFAEVLQRISTIRADVRRSLRDVARYLAIPRDAPSACRCGDASHHSLPNAFERQLHEVPDRVL
jgi:hypothetical protein